MITELFIYTSSLQAVTSTAKIDYYISIYLEYSLIHNDTINTSIRQWSYIVTNAQEHVSFVVAIECNELDNTTI